MKKQSYENHVRYYTPHHFLFYPLAISLIGLAIKAMVNNTANRWEWVGIGGALVLVTWLSFMTRQHYALTCQNRIVRLELRFRYFVLTQQRLELLEPKLTFGQIAALRFASDEELPELVDRTVSENLSPKEIKKNIRNWMPDHMRV